MYLWAALKGTLCKDKLLSYRKGYLFKTDRRQFPEIASMFLSLVLFTLNFSLCLQDEGCKAAREACTSFASEDWIWFWVTLNEWDCRRFGRACEITQWQAVPWHGLARVVHCRLLLWLKDFRGRRLSFLLCHDIINGISAVLNTNEHVENASAANGIRDNRISCILLSR